MNLRRPASILDHISRERGEKHRGTEENLKRKYTINVSTKQGGVGCRGHGFDCGEGEVRTWDRVQGLLEVTKIKLGPFPR